MSSTTTTNNDIIIQTRTEVIRTYLAAYCEPDVARRGELIGRAWSPQGQLIDPPFEGTGHDGISGLASAALSHYPGHTFRLVSEVDHHHAFARYQWALADPAGATVLSGTDFAEFAADGTLQRVVGFFGPLDAVHAVGTEA